MLPVTHEQIQRSLAIALNEDLTHEAKVYAIVDELVDGSSAAWSVRGKVRVPKKDLKAYTIQVAVVTLLVLRYVRDLQPLKDRWDNNLHRPDVARIRKEYLKKRLIADENVRAVSRALEGL